jgi:hypothetical protein
MASMMTAWMDSIMQNRVPVQNQLLIPSPNLTPTNLNSNIPNLTSTLLAQNNQVN